MNQNNPLSRTEDIVVQELNGEILIYDLRDNRAMCLNETSAAVWNACDGSNTVGDIAKAVGNEDIVWLALNELKKEKLVDFVTETPTKFDGLTRREAVRRIGMASLVALPLITGLVAPAAAQTISCGAVCTNSNQCPTGCANCNASTPGGTRVCQ